MSNTLSVPKYIKILVVFTFLNLLILSIRNHLVGDTFFNFLKSNLFSGVMPFLIAIILHYFNHKFNTFFFLALSFVWLIFYPNAPYMISDLIHPHQETLDGVYPNLIIYDTFIVFSIAMLSVFYGFVSLKLMYALFHKRFGHKKAKFFIIFSLLLSCLGFYIGRELKSGTAFGNGYFYSWQLFTEPLKLLKVIWASLFPIKEHASAYYMMLLFGFAQYQLLVMMKDVSDIEGAELITKDKH